MELTLAAALVACVLTAANMIRAQRLYDAARAERQAALDAVRKAFALHNCGAREEAMAVLVEAAQS